MADQPAPSAAAAPDAAEQTDAERLDALDRMLTRLALADDARLAPVLARVLPYAITSLASPAPAVRKLVMEILSHINKRVKHRPEISLPMLDLWKIYTESASLAIVRNFCVVYIEMAFERLPTEEKGNIAPDFLTNISNIPAQHQGIILRLVTKAIGECNIHKVDDTIASKYRAITESYDGLVFADFCFHTLLYQTPPQGIGCPSGLSVAQSDRVTGKLPLKGDILASRKLGILNVIEAMNFAPEIVYPLYLSAASDCQESVSKKGEELLKRKASTVNLEDPSLIKKLFTLFNGTVGAENIAAELKVSPAHASLRMRLMSVFCRSIAAANAFPHTLQCIFGCIYGSGTTSRLKQLGMEFTVWVFKHAVTDQLKLIGPVILSGILCSLDGSSTTETDSTGRHTKIFAYQAIGLLASRMPNLFSDKTNMAIRLFTALRLEDQSLHLMIQEAATSLAAAYKGASMIVLKNLEVLLLENCEVEQSEVRFSAIRWATTLYDTQHCPSRYICMTGASDVKLDIREMALAGLNLLNDVRQSSVGSVDFKYPDVTEMLNYICHQRPQLLCSDDQRNGKLLFPSKTFLSMIKFLMKCFESSDSPNLVKEDPSHSPVAKMCIILENAMSYEGSSELHALALKSLVDLSSREPKLVSLRYADRIQWLRGLLAHVDSDAREAAARLLGIASSALSSSAALTLLSEFTSTLNQNRPTRFENYHGVLCAIGYLTAGCLKQSYIPEEMVKDAVDILVKVVDFEGSALASVAMASLGHIGLRCTLPSINQNSSTGARLTILHEKLTKLLSENDTKAIQKILVSLGHISWNEMSFPHLNNALDLIFSLSRSKVEDVLFAAGEALSFIWGEVPVTADVILETNFVSLSQATNYLTSDAPLVSSNSYERSDCEEAHAMAREEIIKKLFETLIFSSRKEERCAGTVWLVSLTMYCGRHPKILELLPQIQEALSHLLGDPNELTQDLASQGMSIVYELGDASMKELLVHALVNTLTGAGKKKKAIKLMEDSEIFQEGAIGNNPTGGKLSTYKELCSLANEMGQPDLIYKFMDLANYQAALNSKRGAAFGFSKIAKQAGEALQPYLNTLIPRLVRYQYDPDKNIQDSMAHIWKLIVSDPKKAIDEHYDVIVEDLLVQSGSRLWRSREASCLALADIIQGRRYSQVSKHLRKIWTTTFRAMDDIKETVRNAGDSLCRAVSSLTIRLCDVSLTSTSDANETMNIVLPYLLSEGILSKVSSIQKASISLVMKLAKGAGPALRPHLAELVCCMLECLSSLEDQRLNYVEMHAGNAGIKTDKLESLRIAVAKDSPMWETLDICIKVVDKNSLDILVPRLAQMVRSAVGLNTRVGVASFITLLVQKVMIVIKPYSTLLLKLLYTAVLEERSSAAKRAFASSCATVLKYASPSQAQKLIEDTTSLHSGGKNDQLSGAILIKAYLSNAADILGGYNAVVVPVIFVSRSDDDKDTSALYEELWEDIPSSERVTLTLYLPETVSLLCNCMSSSSWAGKRKSAKATKKLCDVLGESLSAHHHNILESLLKELPGRFWEGKDSILDALASLCSCCHAAITAEDSSLPSVILDAVCAACNKKTKLYREAAFLCLQKVITAFRDPGFFNSVFPMLYKVCNQSVTCKAKGSSSTTSSAGAEQDESEGASVSLDKVLNCAMACISVAFPHDIISQKESVLEVILNSLSPEESWQVKLSSFSCVKELCRKFQSSDDSDTWPQDTASLVQELFHLVSAKVVDSIRLIKIAQVHTAASECLLELSKLYRDFPLTNRAEAKFEDELVELCESEKSEQAKTLLKECLGIVRTLPGVTMTTD
ncbi:hypothetical protein PAHAL_3G020000 [Panicum hallii]|uniref:ARM repeat superfamily protein n=1 Tax=Panicum hallii TaxID=206008 RepID=A0A2S3H5M9_9POAL|nr:proteasome adapter and scaffold protein ECM29-like isoform X1 [Panicum hallii]PAN15915.1 hypothetical protein PAHAL_3G020000 [Panicum hallii]